MQEPPTQVASQGLDAFQQLADATDEELVVIALHSRHDLQAGRLRINSAVANRRAAGNSQRPALHAVVAGNNFGNDDGRNIKNGFAGLELSWQLYDGGAARGRKRQASAAVNKATQTLADAELRVAEQVRTSSSAVRSASARLERGRKGLSLAEEAYRIQVLNYENGKGTVNDLLDAQAALFNARAQLVRDDNDLTASHIALALATGQPMQ